jgi:hypothetical protein
MITETTTLNEILGTSSVTENNDTDREDQGKDKGKGADTGADDKSKPPEGALNTDDLDDEDKDKTGKGKLDDGKGEKEKAPPYHKDPDFLAMKERNEARAEKAEAEVISVRGELAELKGTVTALLEISKGKGPDIDKDDPGYKDLTTMSAEEISEFQATDPVGYAANLAAQIEDEIIKKMGHKEAVKATEETQNASRATYDQYVKDNPDFETMWKKGEIQDFMKKNPGHNPLSAHMKLTEEARFNKALDTRVKKIEKDIRAKLKGGTLRGSGGAPRAALSEDDPMLKDPNKYGGRTAVQAERLRQMRAGAGT